VCAARITILSSKLSAGVVNFASAADIIISASVAVSSLDSSHRAVVRVVRGPGVYGIVNVPFQVTAVVTDGAGAIHVTPASGVVTFLDRQVNSA